MIYKYGTSGFRYNSKILMNIARNIGKYLAYYGSQEEKYIGIIITASHNHYKDNGVKIINSDGFLLMDEEEIDCTEYINGKIQLKLGKNIPKILIGNDSRHSGQLIKRLIIGGILDICNDAIIEDINYVSTPQMHYELISLNQKIKILYENYFFNECVLNNDIIVDCSNGIGSKVLKDLEYKEENIINNKMEEYRLLNNNCGSDYICNNQCFPKIYNGIKENNRLYSALDGDADRCIFFYEDINKEFILLNGDSISALYCLFLQKYSNEKITYIHTSYTNCGLINYLKSLNIETKCVATGIKHLQKECLNHKLSVYFESNGHGSIHYNKEIYEKSCDILKKLLRMQNQYTGDGISHIYGVDYILSILEMSKEEWYNLYKNNKSKLYKLEVNDRTIFKCDKNETKLIEPKNIQKELYKLMEESNSNIFVRASGTEDILRVYIECYGEDNFEEIFNKIKVMLN